MSWFRLKFSLELGPEIHAEPQTPDTWIGHTGGQFELAPVEPEADYYEEPEDRFGFHA